ncbi:MAG: anaerobic ribonucleoside-triphosphate reductase activating protein [bacterium]|jgi:pyruvate formate lyase activating enzyme
MSKPQIKGFIETSLCDWDGLISSVVFLPGCNFRCPFCQNAELVLNPESLPSVGFDQIAGYLRAQSSWIDGLVITGGEPTIWGGLSELAEAIKDLGFAVKLDTNGTRPDEIADLLDRGLVDFIAMDIKAPLDERYERAAGVPVDLDRIRRSIDLVMGLKGAHEFRTTLVPGFVGEEEVALMAETVMGAERYALQRFVPDNSLDKALRRAIAYDDSFVSHLLEIAGRSVDNCIYRGRIGVGLS